jgi:ABC-type oligopeptide transport system substrate-binding subunit
MNIIDTSQKILIGDDNFYTSNLNIGIYNITGTYQISTNNILDELVPIIGGIYCNLLIDNTENLYDNIINSFINLNKSISYDILPVSSQIFTINFTFAFDVKTNNTPIDMYFYNKNNNIQFTREQFTITF